MKYGYTLIFVLMIYCAGGQTPVWNKELPFAIISDGGLGISLQIEEDGYLISGAKNIVTLNKAGEVTRAIITPFQSATYGFGSFIRSKTDPQTGEKYFLLAATKLNSPTATTISEYRPGQGFMHETMLDEWFGGTAFSPAFISLNDSTYVILGRKYFRQITHRPGQGVVTNWEILNTLGNPSAGIKTPQGIVGVSQNGVVFALDAGGNTLWADTTIYNLYDIQKAEDQGFLATGRTADSIATVVKFSAGGVIEWTRQYDDDLVYNGLVLEANGSISVTGQSDSSRIVLCHLAADGTVIWRNTYQHGAGRALLRIADGYVMVGQARTRARSFALRTDLLGHTGPMEPYLNPKKRRVQNHLLSTEAGPSPVLFFDVESTFKVPKDSLTNTFFAATPWLGALDQDSVLHLSAILDGHDGLTDYRPGISKAPATDFDRVWWASRAQIDALRQDWADNGVLDQPVPFDISTWPAKGNAGFAYNLDFTKTTTDKSLLPAPFVDANSDGIYNPANGDYPLMKGDEMAWWIITDSAAHTFSNGLGLNVDIAVSMYAYDCSSLTTNLINSLFVDYEIINRSENQYNQMFAGLWSDPDLGCGYDDYVGTLPAVNAMYVYNQDTLDGQNGSSCGGGISGFKNNIPVGSLSFINSVINTSIYLRTTGIVPYPNDTLPYDNTLIYRLLRGVKPNGQPIGYFFPGNPSDQDSSSMCNNGGSTFGADYRMIGSHGPFNLAANDTFRLSTAFTYHPNIPLPCPDIFGTVKNDLEALHTLLQSGALDAPAHLLSNVLLLPGQSALLDATVPGATAYLWSNGATTATISVVQAGAYSVTITRSTGCSSMETVLVTAATPTHEADWLNDLRIFPNPNTGQFNIEVRGAAQSSVECTLYNSLGQFVQRQLVDSSSGSNNYTFNCSYLPTGIYTLQVRAGEKLRYERVVVQH